MYNNSKKYIYNYYLIKYITPIQGKKLFPPKFQQILDVFNGSISPLIYVYHCKMEHLVNVYISKFYNIQPHQH